MGGVSDILACSVPAAGQRNPIPSIRFWQLTDLTCSVCLWYCFSAGRGLEETLSVQLHDTANYRKYAECGLVHLPRNDKTHNSHTTVDAVTPLQSAIPKIRKHWTLNSTGLEYWINRFNQRTKVGQVIMMVHISYFTLAEGSHFGREDTTRFVARGEPI